MYRRRMLAGVLAVTMFGSAAIAVVPATDAEGKPKPRLARGETSQNRGIAVRVFPKAMKLVGFNAELKCRDGSKLIVEEGGFLRTPVRNRGRFSDVQYGRTDTVRFKGRMGSKFVRGQIRVSDRWGKVRCDSRWFKFTARIRG